jgi:hypothetical protein
MWGVAALSGLVVVFGMYKWMSQPQVEHAPVDIMEDDETVVTEEDRELWRMEQAAQEKNRMASDGQRINKILVEIQAAMGKNRQEAEENQVQFKKMFASSKSSYDDDIKGIEDEQNIETAFMLKEDLEGKKKGMITLGQELGKQQEYLQKDMHEWMGKLKRLNSEWQSMFPSEPPMYQPPTMNRPTQPQSQSQSPEQMAAQRAFHEKGNTMMPDGMRDGTGRESIPV